MKKFPGQMWGKTAPVARTAILKNLPLPAQRFILATYFAGVIAVIAACPGILPIPNDTSHTWWELLLLTVLSGSIGWKSLTLSPTRSNQQETSLSISFVLMFWAMLRFGTIGATLTLAVGAFAASYLGRQTWFQMLFNVAACCVQAVVASQLFLYLNESHLSIHLPQSLPALVAACLTQFLINSGAVALVLALCTAQPPFKVWKDNFLWLAPGYLVGAALATAVVYLITTSTLVAVAVLPFAFLIYQGTRTNADRNKELAESQENLANMFAATTRSLALAVDAKDHYTHQHILRVQIYAMATAKKMGIKGDDLQAIETGALLHDVGKVGIPEAILLKPGRLTAEEFDEIKKHPSIGAEILAPVPFPYAVIPIVKYHHERWDGTGYPEGLSKENIPLSARILAVADVYDALTTTRAYRSAWTHEEACCEIRSQSGRHFDPVVVEAFTAIINDLIAQRPFAPPLNPAPQVDERLLGKLETASDPIFTNSSTQMIVSVPVPKVPSEHTSAPR